MTRYFATQFHGDGTETIIDPDLPVSGSPEWTRSLSAPSQLSVSVPFDIPRLTRPDGSPLFERYGTGIYREDTNGVIRGGIVTDFAVDSNGALALDVYGVTSYLNDMPYTDSTYWVNEDPLNIYRAAWAHVQSQPGGNIGVVIDDTTTPVRIGTELEDVNFQTSEGEMVAFEAGPYKMAPWVTDDIGAKMNTLAKDTPFDYLEEDSWSGDTVRHFIRIGYPTIGVRRETGVRLALGENVFTIPDRKFAGTDVADEVLVLGTGEGRDKKRGTAKRTPSGRLRRVLQIDDNTLTSDAQVNSRAQQELADLVELGKITTLIMQEHSNAVIGSFDLGDEVHYVGRQPWGFVEEWVRVVKITESEGSPNITLTVLHTGTVAG